LNKNNLDEQGPRLANLDFLRGLFIILALDQHFTYYINMWYVEYFRDTMALSSTYAIHFPMIGKQVPTDSINYWLALIFTPWVSQIYLTMAAFNLARKNTNKLKVFGLIFLYFVLENFIVVPNLGQAISFYPIMLWMVILSLISIAYRYLGIRGVITLTFISLLRFIVPLEFLSGILEAAIKTHIHPGFEYDARMEYFILSGCLGFLMGYVHYHLDEYKNKKDFFFIGVGSLLVIIYCLFGDRFSIYVDDVFRTEHDLARTFSGTLYILGIQAIIISAFLWMEKKNIKLNFPLLNWVGVNSLLIFALHRILFVRLIAPLSVMFGSLVGRPIGASFVEVFIYIFITLGICSLVKYTPISDIILQRRK
jgi:hypothetical protein